MAGEKIRMYYDPRGQVIRTVNPDDTEQRVLYGVPNNLAVSLGEVDNPSPWESYTYDANDLDTSCDHYATPKSAEVDALGRTIKTIDRLESSNSTSNNVVMKYAYDIRGNLLLVQDAYDRDVFEHKYDLRSPSKEGESIPPLKTIHINKGTSIVVFDCAGKPAETRDAKGALTLHAYDGMQRPQYMWGRDNADENVSMRQCSVYGNDNSTNSIGKVYEHYDESGYERINNYDFKGNVLQKIKQVIADTEILQTIKDSKDGGWVTVGCYRVDWTDLNTGILSSTEYQSDMEYDALNRIKKITYPADASSNRKELIPSYNRAGALHHVEFDGNEYVKDIAYNAKGQRLLIAYGNGLMTRYCYNSKTFRLTRLKTEGYTYSESDYEHTYAYNSGSTKQDFAYIYDKAGNILSITDATPDSGVGGSGSLERDFSYDALYRLLTATGRENQGDVSYPYWEDTTRWDDPTKTTGYEQGYSYDLMGNITELYHHKSANNFTREFTYHDNKLNSIDVGSNTFSFSYDDCGNQTQENSERLFEWDYGDRMRLFYNQTSSGTEPSVYTHYLYDAGGNRVKKFTRTSGGNWQSTTYIDGIIEYTEDDSSNIGSISHIMDDSKRIATVREGYDFGDSTPAVKYNLDDHLGSSNVSVDDAGALVSFEEYYPFGETSFGSYGKKRYRFCGKEKDEESGLYYYGARYYSPWTCRFTSVDPLAGKYPFYTAYQYAGNKPIISIDRDGLEETGKSPQQNPSDSSSTNNTPAASDSTATNKTDTICNSPTPTNTKTDSTDAAKPKPAPKPQPQKATPEKKITGIKLDYSFKSLPGEGMQSTDYKQHTPISLAGTNKNAVSTESKSIVNNSPSIGKQDGKKYVAYEGEIKLGGSLAWRNNNPGNIIAGKWARDNGAIGANGRFAVFPDKETGFKAIISLLSSKQYNHLTIIDAINKYAPATDNNDPIAYANSIANKTGLSIDTKIKDLSNAELTKVANVIEKIEGSIKGQTYTAESQNLPNWAKKILANH
jgi:RHS repeat-associated protein